MRRPWFAGPPFRRAAVRGTPVRGSGAPGEGIAALRKGTRCGILGEEVIQDGGRGPEEDRKRTARVLLAMTAVEAAVMDLQETIEREREAMRTAIERREEG